MWARQTYARDDGVMACEMRLAVLAAEDLVGVEVRVVDETHAGRLMACGRRVCKCARLGWPKVTQGCFVWLGGRSRC